MELGLTWAPGEALPETATVPIDPWGVSRVSSAISQWFASVVKTGPHCQSVIISTNPGGIENGAADPSRNILRPNRLALPDGQSVASETSVTRSLGAFGWTWA